MRVLLDECLPKRLKTHFPGHSVVTVPEAGWAGKKNGDLLRSASGLIDVFITVDSNLAYQQHLSGLPLLRQVHIALVAARSRCFPTSSLGRLEHV